MQNKTNKNLVIFEYKQALAAQLSPTTSGLDEGELDALSLGTYRWFVVLLTVCLFSIILFSSLSIKDLRYYLFLARI